MGTALVLPPVVALASWFDNLLFLLPQYITHPAEQSVLIHILWANVNLNSSGESRCALVLLQQNKSPCCNCSVQPCFFQQTDVLGHSRTRDLEALGVGCYQDFGLKPDAKQVSL